MKAYGIQWDTDGEEVNLPTEMIIPKGIEEEGIADYLSDETGFCVFSFKIATFSPSDAKKMITNYVQWLLYLHDMSVNRNERYQMIADKIVNCCMNTLSEDEMLSVFTNKNQIEYFVRQTILYMIDSPE